MAKRHFQKIERKCQIFSVTSLKAQYAHNQWQIIKIQQVATLHQISISICRLFYRHSSGDHRVTGVHGSTRQGESFPTIYPKV